MKKKPPTPPSPLIHQLLYFSLSLHFIHYLSILSFPYIPLCFQNPDEKIHVFFSLFPQYFAHFFWAIDNMFII